MRTNPEQLPADQNPASTTANFWNDNKLLFKGLLVGFMILLLMIPSFMVNNLVNERAERQQQVIEEVSSKWAGQQTLTGPFLMIPYSEILRLPDGKESITNKQLYLLPEQLSINGSMIPELRKRSLYKVNLYRSQLAIEGNFPIVNFHKLGIDSDRIHWEQARLIVGIADTRGLESSVLVNWNKETVPLEAGVPENAICTSGLHSPMLFIPSTSNHFSLELNLRGSERLYFSPLGKTTTVKLQSTWKDPAFDGAYLPQTSDISDTGFVAQWKVLEESRGYPQIFTNIAPKVSASTFGVLLLQTTDGYTKTERAVKYSFLFISLTFTVFFLMELIQKRAIHPLQYILVGFSLLIFYALLLSISEYIGFDLAYFIAATATILLIALYVGSIFQKKKFAIGFGLALASLYGYIFFLLQLQDYALVFGSIGLFVVVALVMYSSRKIDWYAKTKK